MSTIAANRPIEHEPGREDIPVPRLELQLRASRLELHDKRIAFRRHHCLAEARIGELTGQRRERLGTAVGLAGLANSLAAVPKLASAAFNTSAT